MRVQSVLREQDGVIARRQALACGMTPNDLRRVLRNREWCTVYPGVYFDHTGPLTWDQRAWAAILDAWPAALGRESALPDPGPAIHIVVHRRAHLDDVVRDGTRHSSQECASPVR